MNSSPVIIPSELFPASGECTGEDARFPTNQENGERFRSELGRDPDLWLYRERTIALLKRYLRISIEVGRLPSLLGRELFRSKVSIVPDVKLRRRGDLCARCGARSINWIVLEKTWWR